MESFLDTIWNRNLYIGIPLGAFCCSLFLLFLISFYIPIYSRILRIQKITDFFVFNQKNGMSFSAGFSSVFQLGASFPQIYMNIIESSKKERRSLENPWIYAFFVVSVCGRRPCARCLLPGRNRRMGCFGRARCNRGRIP